MDLSYPHVDFAEVDRFLAGELSPAMGSMIMDHSISCKACDRRVHLVALLRLNNGNPLAMKTLHGDRHCLLDSILIQYTAGRSLPETTAHINAHVSECYVCRRSLDFIRNYNKN